MMRLLLVSSLLVVFVSACNDTHLFSKNKVTAYPLIRIEGKWTTGNKFIYNVFPEKQMVIELCPAFLNLEPKTYTDCSIFDNNNWKCIYSDKSGSFGCNNGKFYTDDEDEELKHVRWYVWWYKQIIQ